MRTHTREQTYDDHVDSVDRNDHSRTSRGRQIAGALVIMAGAIPIALIARSDYYGRPPRLWSVILAVGVVATIAWLVDGRRYLGVAAGATAIGAAFTIAQEADVEKYQFALIFGLLGLGLLLVRMANSRAVGATAGLLLAIGASAATWQYLDPLEFNEAWFYVALMLVWGGIQLLRALHRRRDDSDRLADSYAYRDGRHRDWDVRDLTEPDYRDRDLGDTVDVRDRSETSRR